MVRPKPINYSLMNAKFKGDAFAPPFPTWNQVTSFYLISGKILPWDGPSLQFPLYLLFPPFFYLSNF